ncbi:MAG: hypothetical protein R3E48_11135 [Burkholderiaceae bacterium]
MAGADEARTEAAAMAAEGLHVPSPALPPPAGERGPLAWLRRNLFSTPLNAAMTLLILAGFAWVLPPVLDWLVFKAVWGPQPIAACEAARGSGACWAVVWEKFRVMMFGTYPYAEQWRPGLAIVVLCGLLVVSALRMFWPGAGDHLGGRHCHHVLAHGRGWASPRCPPRNGAACR